MPALSPAPALPDRWSALARSSDLRVMGVVILLSLALLMYFIATLNAAVARGPWHPEAAARQDTAVQPATPALPAPTTGVPR